MDDHQTEIESNRAGRILGLALIAGGIVLAIYMCWTAIVDGLGPRKGAGFDPLPQLRWEDVAALTPQK